MGKAPAIAHDCGMPDGVTVRRMFAEIAPRYDLVNRVLSLGIDVRWRKETVRELGLQPGERVLDACTGTGDLALALARAGAVVTATDFCPEMLVQGRPKTVAKSARQPLVLAADTLALPFAAGTFSAATVAFGIRNVADPVAGLAELRRVVAPGGRIVVLEFCKPSRPVFRGLYGFYFRRVLPRVGRWISGERAGAYQYLPDSVHAFPEREGFLELMRRAGLEAPRYRLLSLGIAAIYRAEVPR